MFFSLASVARAGLALLAVAPSALGRALNEPQTRALPPDSDPFYKPPAGFESAAAGDVLRSRRIFPGFFGFIPDPVEAYQVLYRTEAIDGTPIATVTTIFKPLFAKTDRFVSYHTAYDSSGTICNPSYSYQLGSFPVNPLNSVELLEIQLYLLNGYIVSSPDYEGPEASFATGHLTGKGVLDNMRAVTNFRKTLGLSSAPKIVGMGYSGGGLATGWAAALQPTYAPELSIKGWAAGGIPANLTAILLTLDKTVASGFEAVAVAGLLKPSAYGKQLQPLVDRIITPAGRKVLATANTKCTVDALVSFPFQSVLSTDFQSLGPDLLYEPTVSGILADNTLGVKKDQTPTAPLMQYHATPDEIVPYGPAAILRKSWCDFGATVKFTEYAAGGHGTTVVLALLDVLQFTKDAFAGSVPAGCTSRTLLNNKLDPLALGVMLEPLAVGLINWLASMGDKDAKWLASIKNGDRTAVANGAN